MAKKLSEDLKKRIVALHKDGVGYKKIAKTLKLSCSTVAKKIQRFNRTGSTQNMPRHGRPKKLSARAQHHIQRLCLGNRHMSASRIAGDVEGWGGQPVSAQTIRCTLHQICLHGCRPRRKPLLKMMHKKACKQFAEDNQIREHGLLEPCLVVWWDQDKHIWYRWCQASLAATRWGVQRQVCLPIVKHGGGSVIVWGSSSAASTGELQFIEGTMKQSMILTEAEHDPLPSETGLQGGIPTWQWP